MTPRVTKLEALIASSGGGPQYVSASAGATEMAAAGLLESTFPTAGSMDPATAALGDAEGGSHRSAGRRQARRWWSSSR